MFVARRLNGLIIKEFAFSLDSQRHKCDNDAFGICIQIGRALETAEGRSETANRGCCSRVVALYQRLRETPVLDIRVNCKLPAMWMRNPEIQGRWLWHAIPDNARAICTIRTGAAEIVSGGGRANRAAASANPGGSCRFQAQRRANRSEAPGPRGVRSTRSSSRAVRPRMGAVPSRRASAATGARRFAR